MRDLVLVLALATAVAACSERTPEPERKPAPSAASPWELQASATAGVAIVLIDPEFGEQLRIACRREPAELYVLAPAFSRIGSEERLTLGAGDELATLVVSPQTPEGRPVEAVGPLSEGFVAALEAGRSIAASYGASKVGAAAPPEEVRTAFAGGCRGALTGATGVEPAP